MKPILILGLLILGFNQIIYSQKPHLVIPLVSAESVDKIIFTSDGQNLLTTYNDRTLNNTKYVFWDKNSGRYLFDIGSQDPLESESIFTRDNKYLLLFGSGIIKCWDIWNNSIKWEKAGKIVGYNYFNENVLIDNNSYGFDKSCSIYDIETGDSLATIKSEGKSIEYLYSNTGKYTLINSFNSRSSYEQNFDTIKVYNVKEEKILYEFYNKAGVKKFFFSNDDDYLIALFKDSSLICVQTETGDVVFKKHLAGEIKILKLSPKSELLLAIVSNSKSYSSIQSSILQTWKVSNGEGIDSININESVVEAGINNESTLISLISDSLRFYDRKTGKFFNLYKPEKDFYMSTGEFSPDGESFAVGMSNGMVELFDIAKHLSIQFFSGMPTPLIKTKFVTDSTFVSWNDHNMTSGVDDWFEWMSGYIYWDMLKKWSLNNGKQILKSFNNGKSFGKISVSLNGKYAITYETNTTISIWNNSSTKKISTFMINPDLDYFSFFFSDNGRKLVYSTISKERSLHKYGIEAREIQSGKLVSSIDLTDFPEILGVSYNADSVMLQYDGKIPGTENYGSWLQLLNIKTKKTLFQSGGLTIHDKNYVYNDQRSFFLPKDNSFFAHKKDSLALTNYKGFHANFALTPYCIDANCISQEDILISKNGRYLLTHVNNLLFLWNGKTGILLDTFNLIHQIDQYQFSVDENNIVIAKCDNDKLFISTWDIPKKLKTSTMITDSISISSNYAFINSLSLSPNNRFALISTTNNSITIYDLKATQILYKIIPLGLNDYLTIDKEGRFDGSPKALKLAYYTCGKKVIDLDKLSETGYENNLVSKIMCTKKSNLKAKSLINLKICENK